MHEFFCAVYKIKRHKDKDFKILFSDINVLCVPFLLLWGS